MEQSETTSSKQETTWNYQQQDKRDMKWHQQQADFDIILQYEAIGPLL